MVVPNRQASCLPRVMIQTWQVGPLSAAISVYGEISGEYSTDGWDHQCGGSSLLFERVSHAKKMVGVRGKVLASPLIGR